MSYLNGNKKDGKHYWLTPDYLMKKLNHEFGFTFDACPHPKPENFNGLVDDWGKSTYVNPPFGSIIFEGKKKGPTAWARKAIEEYKKGNKVVMVYPVDKWVLMLIKYCTEIRNLGDVKWCATEDGSNGPGIGRHTACFILDPENHQQSKIEVLEKENKRLRVIESQFNDHKTRMRKAVNKNSDYVVEVEELNKLLDVADGALYMNENCNHGIGHCQMCSGHSKETREKIKSVKQAIKDM